MRGSSSFEREGHWFERAPCSSCVVTHCSGVPFEEAESLSTATEGGNTLGQVLYHITKGRLHVYLSTHYVLLGIMLQGNSEGSHYHHEFHQVVFTIACPQVAEGRGSFEGSLSNRMDLPSTTAEIKYLTRNSDKHLSTHPSSSSQSLQVPNPQPGSRCSKIDPRNSPPSSASHQFRNTPSSSGWFQSI